MEDYLRQLYLDSIKRCILGLIYEDAPSFRFDTRREFALNFLPGRKKRFDLSVRKAGLDWPSQAHSMIGLERMNNLQACVEQVIAEGVPGDLIETGVWRGGACILMRAILTAHGISDRIVWLADSFEGLPAPKMKQDRRLRMNKIKALAVSVEQVKRNFEAYGLLDDQVRFLKGWFRDILPAAPINQLAVLRMDGDLYESTMDSLSNLYPKLTIGGFAIVDDFNLEPCRQAVKDYREQKGVTEDIVKIDDCGVFWRREK